MNIIENASMQQRRGTAEYWEQNGSFVPKDGQIIVIHDHSGEKTIAIKIGDGVTPVSALRAISGEFYAQPDEPLYAEDGAIWIKTDVGADGKGRLGLSVDWDNNANNGSYIANRPFYLEQHKATWNKDNSSLEKRLMSSLQPTGKDLTDGQISYIDSANGSTVSLPIVGYFDSWELFEAYWVAHQDESFAYVLSGAVLLEDANNQNDYIMYSDSRNRNAYFAFINRDIKIAPIGIYANDDIQWRQTHKLEWLSIKVDPRYNRFFKEINSIVKVDASLTQGGMAADARIVGEALARLYNEKGQIQIITWEDGD